MIHPSTQLRFISDDIGYGVVATEFIPKGTITWALDDLDQIVPPERVASFSPEILKHFHKYAFVDGRGRHILCWDHARFVNHDCDANCLGGGYEFEVAVRDIYPGEQLTDDYGGLNIEENFHCLCGSAACRGLVRPDDILTLADEWDRRLKETFALIGSISQPLWPIVRSQEQIREVLEGRATMNSSRLHYYPGHRAAL